MLGLDRVVGLGWVLNFPFNSFICLVKFAYSQQHPQFEFNKIKTKFVPSCVPCVWCTCVCQPHPYSDVLSSAQQIQTRRTLHMFPRKRKEFRTKVKPGGLHQAGRPKIVAISTNASFPEQQKPSLHAYEKIPDFCHRCRPACIS
jgi:hypothetical protein